MENDHAWNRELRTSLEQSARIEEEAETEVERDIRRRLQHLPPRK